MAAEDVAKIVVLMCSLPPEVNLYEATILPNHMRSFIGRSLADRRSTEHAGARTLSNSIGDARA